MPDPKIKDITMNKGALASSYMMPYEPKRAVDGFTDFSNRWVCTDAEEGWLMIRLGGYFKVTRWKVTCAGYAGWDASCNLNSCKLQCSVNTNGEYSWMDIPRQSVIDNRDNTFDRTIQTPVLANALRLYITKGDARPRNHLASVLDFTAYGYPVSNNANLSSLILSDGILTPVFCSNCSWYTAKTSKQKITVTPTAADPEATILVNGQPVASGTSSNEIDLFNTESEIRIEVISPDTTNKTSYYIDVTKVSDDAGLSRLTISNGTLKPAFQRGKLSYSAVVGNEVEYITVTPTANTITSTIAVNKKEVDSGCASEEIPLVVGENTIEIVVTAEAGNTKNYKLVVKREAAVKPVIEELSVSYVKRGLHTVPANREEGTTSYQVSIPASVANVIPVTSDPSYIIEINGIQVTSGGTYPVAKSDTSGWPLITIIVSDADKTASTTYTLTII